MKTITLITVILIMLTGCASYTATPEKIKMESSELYALQKKDAMYPRNSKKVKFDEKVTQKKDFTPTDKKSN